MKKVIIIDDSALMRRVLSDIIESDKRFILSDVASNGLEGLDLITLDIKKYDVIILDINMPRMNGIELLEKLNSQKIKIPVIIVSSIAKEGTKETIRCLELGAFDFIKKPESFMESKGLNFRNRIIDMLAAATGLESVKSKAAQQAADTSASATAPKPAPSIDIRRDARATIPYAKQYVKRPHVQTLPTAKKIVAIACSTGGPKALQTMLPMFPMNLNAPVVLVQHMPGGFTATLAQRLDELSKLEVKEAKDGDILRAGRVYIAKGGSQMRIVKSGGIYSISLTDEPPRNALKPCADIMYESLAELDYDEIVCAVLTGMGNDGMQGIAKLNERHNLYVVTQDEASSTVYGMPRAVKEVGLSDEVLPLDRIADAVTKIVGVK